MSYKSLILALAAVCAMPIVAAADTTDPKCFKTEEVFDIGSSSTKMSIFKVDACAKKIIYPRLFPSNAAEAKDAKISLEFKKDLQKSVAPETRDQDIADEDLPRFTEAMRLNALKVFKRLDDLGKPYNPTVKIGVATEAFREAKNGADYVDEVSRKLGIKILVPSQLQEAQLEWLGATQDLVNQGIDIPLNNLVSFGIGGGSMQIGARMADSKFQAYQSQLASADMYLRAKREIKGVSKDQSLMPVTLTQINAMVDLAMKEAGDNAPSNVRDRVQTMGMETLGVGGVINGALKGVMKCLGVRKKYFLASDVQEYLNKLADKESTDTTVLCRKMKEKDKDGNLVEVDVINDKDADSVPANLALILGTMKAIGLDGKPVYFSAIDNTYAAPFLEGLAPQMVARKWKPKPKTILAQNTSAPGSAGPAAPGAKPTVKIAEPKADDLEAPPAPGDTSMADCISYNAQNTIKNGVCTINSCVFDATQCPTKYDAKTNYCEDATQGHKLKLIFTGGVCQK